jgi:hypothetical protein
MEAFCRSVLRDSAWNEAVADLQRKENISCLSQHKGYFTSLISMIVFRNIRGVTKVGQLPTQSAAPIGH